MKRLESIFVFRWWIILGFVFSMALINLIAWQLRSVIWFIIHDFYPLSVVWPKSWEAYDWITLIIALGWLTFIYIKRFDLSRTKLWLVIFLYLITVTLFSGIDGGFSYPITGQGKLDQNYYTDARLNISIPELLNNYTRLQPTLSYHSRVHPPGPVLLMRVFIQMKMTPWIISLALGMLTLFSINIVEVWMERHVDFKSARLMAILIGLSPSMAVYGIASLEGVIMMLTLGWWYGYELTESRGNIIILAVILTVISWLSFAVIWHFLAIILYEMFKDRNWRKLFKIMGIWTCGWLAAGYIWGYSYWDSLRMAMEYEGFRSGHLLQLLPSFAITRAQDILEPMIFMGPFVIILVAWAVKKWPNQSLSKVSLASLLAFIIFILGGAYYTGETARGAWHVFVPLITPLALILRQKNNRQRWEKWLLATTAGQGLIMQALFFWTW